MALDLKIFTENVDPEAVNQIYTLVRSQAFLGQKVRIMPDVHCGTGCVVGFTSTLGERLVPNVLGVDLGCGMLTAELGDADIDYAALDVFIKQNIPCGSAVRKEVLGEDIIGKLACKSRLRDLNRLYGSLGTLGGGNHFIEVDADEAGKKYLVIHSGSRNLGLQVAKIYMKEAYAACKSCADAERERVIASLKQTPAKIPDAIAAVNAKYAARTKTPAELCYLEGSERDGYFHDLILCQEFASRNRRRMCEDIVKFLGIGKYTFFETIHNFIGEDGVIRKGAIPAHEGQRVIIPMNMRDGCLIAVGKGNPDWNYSAPHGAGRICKRSEAKQYFTVEEFKETMAGVYSSTVNESTLDESPMAYKPAAEIMALISPTVDIEKIIKPVYNFKAGNE